MRTRDVAGLLLAMGFVLALNVLAVAVLVDVLHTGDHGRRAPTDVLLTGWGAGVTTGALGVLLAFRVAGSRPAPDPRE